MNTRIWAASHVGLVRQRNEDAFGTTGLEEGARNGEVVFAEALAPHVLVVVADGLGGHPSGDVASRIAVQAVLDAKPDDGRSLVEAVQYANDEVVAAMSAADGSIGMGSTLVAALIREDGLAVANVGDSPAFEIVDERLVQLTMDDVAGASPGLPGIPSSVLTQSLGGGARLQEVDVHLYEDEHPPPRRLLLCTDGLTSYVSRSSIAAEAIAGKVGATVVGGCIELALDAGGLDNVTVLLVDVS
jgi:serine/threonine protein phosphatase PrpC